ALRAAGLSAGPAVLAALLDQRGATLDEAALDGIGGGRGIVSRPPPTIDTSKIVDL
ncbi:hypothetical protein HMPREF0731_4580, partial [Pseudoroseomonas cervicalis ATCC 49957]